MVHKKKWKMEFLENIFVVSDDMSIDMPACSR